MANTNGGSPRAPNGDGVVVVENVLVTRRSEFGWHCVINGRAVFVGHGEIAPGTSMPQERQHGRVTLTPAAALRARLP